PPSLARAHRGRPGPRLPDGVDDVQPGAPASARTTHPRPVSENPRSITVTGARPVGVTGSDTWVLWYLLCDSTQHPLRRRHPARPAAVSPMTAHPPVGTGDWPPARRRGRPARSLDAGGPSGHTDDAAHPHAGERLVLLRVGARASRRVPWPGQLRRPPN